MSTEVSALAQALQKLSTENGSDESFTQLVLGGLTSNDHNTQQATVHSLLSLVTNGSESGIKAKRDTIFSEHALAYLPALFNITPPPSSSGSLEIAELVLLCIQHCSAREAILALSEACQGIEERFFGCMVSDDEDAQDEDGNEQDGGGVVDLGIAERVIPGQMKLLFQALGIAFTRMPKIKSTPTLLTLADTLESALIHLGSLISNSGDDSIARAALEMIEKAWEWVQRSTDAGGEQRAILSQLFYLSISLFSPGAHDSLKRWFSAKYPRYAQIRTQQDQMAPAAGLSRDDYPLSAASRTASTLKLDSHTLIDNIAGASVGSRVSPHASFASLILIAHKFAVDACSATTAIDAGAGDVLHLPPLSDTLTLITAALGSTAIDAGLTYLWEVVSRAEVGEVEADDVEQLVENLFPLSATQPDPLMRLAVWKLVSEIVHKVSDVSGKIRLLRQLLEPANPFVQIRIQAFVLLRQELSDAARQSGTSTPTLLSPAIFALPLSPSPTDLSDLSAALSSSPAAADGAAGPLMSLLTEHLVVMRFLYDLDVHNATGIRDAPRLLEIKDKAMMPVKSAIGREQGEGMIEEIGGSGDVLHGFGVAFGLERLREAISDLEAVVR